MRIRVAYTTSYTYEAPARSIVQLLRVMPRSHTGQHVAHWRVDADADVRMRTVEDAFGNIVHSVSVDQAVQALTLTVTGEAATTDTAGVVKGTTERLPDMVYLRETPLTHPDPRLRAFALDVAGSAGDDPLTRLHALLNATGEAVSFETGMTDAKTTAAQALELGRGVCQDLTHVFVSGARVLGLPARYVSGHLQRNDGVIDQDASHAWAEAKVPGLGWVGFDAVNGLCPTDAYVRVAVGLDYLDAAPVRGSRRGGGTETMTVKLAVWQSQHQSQSQSQSGGGRQSQSQSQGQGQSQQ